MRSACSKLFLVVCLFLTATEQAHSQPLFAHAESIAATVANADLVFIATLVKFGDAERTEGREVHDATIVIEQTLKQDIFKEEAYQRLQIRIPGPALVLADWKQRSSRLLVAYDEYAPDATTVIELVPGTMEVLEADFTLLRDPEDVIRAAEQALLRMPAGVRRIHNFRLQVPRELVAETRWDKYYATGGYLLLSVPVDEQLENRAIEYIQSESYRNREEGIRALPYFRSDENIVRARTLLDDPGWAYLYQAQENNGVQVRIYGVRQEAYRTLKCWGTDVEKPLIRMEVRN